MTCAPMPQRRRATPGCQRGIAAIEFAGVCLLLFLLLYGLATFAAVLYTQQAVSRAAEDGARVVSMLPAAPVANDPLVRQVVYDSLAGSLITPSPQGSSTAARRAWLVAQIAPPTVSAVSAAALPGGVTAWTVGVSYPYAANRLLPSLPLIDASRWMPATLVAHATAVRQP